MIIAEKTGEQITNSESVYKIASVVLAQEDAVSQEREHFYVFGLDAKNRVAYIELCHLGTLTSASVHPREVYRIAVLKGCASIVCVHNHPSGDTEPSRDDIATTKRLEEAGDILGIKLLDHVIIGDGYKSLKEAGYNTKLKRAENMKKAKDHEMIKIKPGLRASDMEEAK